MTSKNKKLAVVGLPVLVGIMMASQAQAAESAPWRLQEAAGLPDWISLSGTFRIRYEGLHNQFRAGKTGNDQIIALRTTLRNLGRIGPETSILTFAMTMGVVFEACLPATGLLDAIRALSLSPATIIVVVVMAMNVFGLMGVHPIVTGTVLLVIFTGIDTGLADLVLFEAMLTGWGLCTTISLGSLSIATGSAMFDIPPTRLISLTNIGYVFLTSALIVAVLAALNLVLAPAP